jgi:hypothetical protein
MTLNTVLVVQHPMIRHVAGFAYWILFLISFFGNGAVIFIFLKVKMNKCHLNGLSHETSG